jgi:hypothetical protein
LIITAARPSSGCARCVQRRQFGAVAKVGSQISRTSKREKSFCTSGRYPGPPFRQSERAMELSKIWKGP